MNIKPIIEEFSDRIKDILKVGPRHLVGIDIGLSAVKVCEVKHGKNKITLKEFEHVFLPEGALIEDEIQKPDEISAAIKKAILAVDDKVQFGVVGLFGPNVVAKRLQLAGGSDEEIEDQVHWEGEQYFPFSMDESSIGFQVLGENLGGGVDVIVGAGKNDVISNFKNVVEQSGIKLKIADLNVLAIINVFEFVFKDRIKKSNETFLILESGAQKTNFIIYKNKGISFTKEIPLGGVNITEEIQRQMGVNYEEAEDLKKTVDENGNLPEEILDIIDETVGTFFGEIKKTLDFYISSSGEEELKTCIATGGNCLIPNMLVGLQELIEMNVELLDPFEVLEWNEKKISDEKINYIRHCGVAAIGLAMRTPKK